MQEIASAANPLVKLVRSLASRKHRDATGLFAAEGIEYAKKVRARGFSPHLLLVDSARRGEPAVAELVAWAAKHGARTAALPHALLARVSHLNNPQTVIVVLRQRWVAAGAPAHGTALALDSIRDPGNLGTIIRTAEAAAVSRLFLVGESCDPFSPEAVRASAGSIFAVEMTAVSRQEFLERAGNWPGDVVGAHLTAVESFRQSYRRPVLLLMGSESHGLKQELTAACSRVVRIPMAPGIESLNVATATALMLYEVQLPLLEAMAKPT